MIAPPRGSEQAQLVKRCESTTCVSWIRSWIRLHGRAATGHAGHPGIDVRVPSFLRSSFARRATADRRKDGNPTRTTTTGDNLNEGQSPGRAIRRIRLVERLRRTGGGRSRRCHPLAHANGSATQVFSNARKPQLTYVSCRQYPRSMLPAPIPPAARHPAD